MYKTRIVSESNASYNSSSEGEDAVVEGCNDEQSCGEISCKFFFVILNINKKFIIF